VARMEINICFSMQRTIPMRTTRQFAATAALACLSALSGHVAAQQVFPMASAATTPSSDAFYKAPSTTALTMAQPGDILRYRAIPLNANGYASFVSEGYQVMYRTADGQNNPTAAIATILIPKNTPAKGRKLLAYQSFYDSLTIDCTPSYLTVQGKLFEENNIDSTLKKGIVVVLSDYEGLNSQWIAGMNTAHGVLDGIRSAIKFGRAGVDPNAPVAMMGFSGGGHATGWAAEVAPEYAPELNIVGAAMGGVPVMPGNVAKKVDGTFFASVYFGAVVGLARAYPQIDPNKYATTAGLAMIKDMGNRCLLGMFEGKPDMLLKYAFNNSSKYLKDANFLDLPEIASIIQENSMTTRTPKVPLYVYEGTADEIMPIADVDALVQRYCNAGVKVQYHRIAGGDHLGMALSPDAAISYVQDRLDGKAPPSTCQ
jgi:pimeloyl-ACP methyl ester carboxylesterase